MSGKIEEKILNIQIREESRDDNGERICVFYRADNSETEDLLTQKLVSVGYIGSFANADGNEIKESDINNLYIAVYYSIEFEESSVEISYNDGYDFVLVKKTKEILADDSEKVRLIIQEYLTKDTA